MAVADPEGGAVMILHALSHNSIVYVQGPKNKKYLTILFCP